MMFALLNVVLATVALLCMVSGVNQMAKGSATIRFLWRSKEVSGVQAAFWGGGLVMIGLLLAALTTGRLLDTVADPERELFHTCALSSALVVLLLKARSACDRLMPGKSRRKPKPKREEADY
jgi:hypothetical protein